MESSVSASILSADLGNLERVVKEVESWGVDMLHFDVMDGVFVPNLSFGLPVLSAIERRSDLFMDVHLMISDPTNYIVPFVKAGADMITIHVESKGDATQNLRAIRQNGAKAGLALKPGTPIEAAFPYLHIADTVLLMTVEPGFGGQDFMAEVLPKIRALRAYMDAHAPHVSIQVDGGINSVTALLSRDAGANQLVAGSYLFGAENPVSAVASLRG